MKRNDEIRYTTGEFAKYFGIKKDTLLYYDKIKLFCPAGVCENGYRYYTSSQIEPFWTLLSLRDLNVPIKVLQSYFGSPDPDWLCEIVNEQLKHIKEEIKKLQVIQRMLTQISDATQEAQNAVLEQVSIQELPAKRLLLSAQIPSESVTTVQQWSKVYDEFVLERGLNGVSYIGSVLQKTICN